MRPRVVVTRHVYPEAIDLLAGVAEVDYRDERDGEPVDALAARLEAADALLCQLTDRVPAALFDRAPRLRIVANVAVGYDNIDVAAASRHGILVTNTPGVLTESTADFTFALLLAAARRLAEADRFVRARRWQRWEIDLLCGQDVHGRTLGIVGMGRIGRAVARRAAGFGMEVVYTTLRPPAAPAPGRRLEDLGALLAASDFVSLHVPLTAATRHLIGAAELERMQRHAVLVNTARGPIVDEQALVAALRTGEIGAAGLDVFEREPELAVGLAELDNVVLAPHLGSASVATRTRMCTMAAENVVSVLRGERPPNLVDPEAWQGRRA